MASSDSGERKRGRNSEWRKHWPKGAGWIWNHDEQTLISKCRSRSVDIIGPGTNEIVGMSFVLSRKRFALLLLLLFPARNGVVIREDRSSVLTKAWWLPACASSSPSPSCVCFPQTKRIRNVCEVSREFLISRKAFPGGKEGEICCLWLMFERVMERFEEEMKRDCYYIARIWSMKEVLKEIDIGIWYL